MTIKWSLGLRLSTVDFARYWGSIEVCCYVLVAALFGVQYFLSIDIYPKGFTFAQNNYGLKRDTFCVYMMVGSVSLAVASFLMSLGAIERCPPLIFPWFLTTPCVIVYGLILIAKLRGMFFLPFLVFQAIVLVSVAVFVFRIYRVKIEDNRFKKINANESSDEQYGFETVILDEQVTTL